MKKYINIEIDDLNNKVNFKYDGIFELHELYKTLVFMIEKIEKCLDKLKQKSVKINQNGFVVVRES